MLIAKIERQTTKDNLDTKELTSRSKKSFGSEVEQLENDDFKLLEAQATEQSPDKDEEENKSVRSRKSAVSFQTEDT